VRLLGDRFGHGVVDLEQRVQPGRRQPSGDALLRRGKTERDTTAPGDLQPGEQNRESGGVDEVQLRHVDDDQARRLVERGQQGFTKSARLGVIDLTDRPDDERSGCLVDLHVQMSHGVTPIRVESFVNTLVERRYTSGEGGGHRVANGYQLVERGYVDHLAYRGLRRGQRVAAFQLHGSAMPGDQSADLPLADELGSIFARVSRLLLSREVVERALTLVTTLAKETFPETSGAGITLLDQDGRTVTAAATDALVEDVADEP
jgi:hypothetical protein